MTYIEVTIFVRTTDNFCQCGPDHRYARTIRARRNL